MRPSYFGLDQLSKHQIIPSCKMRNNQNARAPQVPCLKITHIAIRKINVHFIRSASIPDLLVKRYDKEIQAWRALANLPAPSAVGIPDLGAQVRGIQGVLRTNVDRHRTALMTACGHLVCGSTDKKSPRRERRSSFQSVALLAAGCATASYEWERRQALGRLLP